VHGRRYRRELPQGTQISSFFGNIFLKPIDDAFAEIARHRDIRYFRYMDDIRIFAREYCVAREAILLLDEKIRFLHLNLQTSKTRILEERHGEISAALLDKRLSQIDAIREKIESESKANRPPDYREVHRLIEHVLNEQPTENGQEQRIRYAQKPLKGLSDRVFRSLLTLSLATGSDKLVDRLLAELRRNADYRLGLKLTQYAKRFSRKAKIQSKLMDMLCSGEKLLPFQVAQILQVIRYQSRVLQPTVMYCLNRASEDAVDAQIRVEALRLLARCALREETIALAERVFRKAERMAVKKAATLILVRQRGQANSEFIRTVVFHPHNGLRKLGRFYRVVKNDEAIAERIREQAFKEDFLMVDYLPLLYLMVESGQSGIVEALLTKIKGSKAHKEHAHMDMRDRVQELLRFGEQNLRARERDRHA
jgi:hypothetical protein